MSDTVTRFEVIDHRPESKTFGRAFIAWNCHVELSYQDNHRTLKVFVVNGKHLVPPVQDRSNTEDYRLSQVQAAARKLK